MSLEITSLQLDTSKEGIATLKWSVSESSGFEGFLIEYKEHNGVWALYDKASAETREISLHVVNDILYNFRIEPIPKIVWSEISGEVKTRSIKTQLSTDKTAIEIVYVPSVADKILVAGMPKLSSISNEVKYTSDSWEDPFGHNLPVTQKVYTPKVGYPVVDMLALKEGKSVGNWAGRKETIPAKIPIEKPKETIEEQSKVKAIVGTQGVLGWGPLDAELLVKDFKAVRLEEGTNETAKAAIAAGFDPTLMSVIVGNTDDGTALSNINISSWVTSTMAQIKTVLGLGVTHLEGGNEMYLKAQGFDAKTYSSMMISLYEAIDSAGIGLKVRVGISCINDTLKGKAVSGGGWLREVLTAQPQLAQRADYWITHPYPAESGEVKDIGWMGNCGPEAVKTQVAIAKSLGVKNNIWAITEFGVQLYNVQYANGTQERQASMTKEYMSKFLEIPEVYSLYYYQVHDTGEGSFGLVTTPTPAGPLPWEPRKVYEVVKSFV